MVHSMKTVAMAQHWRANTEWGTAWS